MRNFLFNLPVKIYFGKNEFENANKYFYDLGKKPLILTMNDLNKKTDIVKKFLDNLNKSKKEYVIFDEIVSNPRAEAVDLAVNLFLENNCDFIVALGGGSVMDTAKAVSAVAKNGGKCSDYIQGDEKGLWKKLLPVSNAYSIVAIPTLAATGSEANNIAVITNFKKKEKGLIFGEALFPKIAIIDPVLTYGVPQSITSDGACDIVSHNIESYLTGEDTELQDRMSEGLIISVMNNTKKAMDNGKDYDSRAILSWASTIALSNFLNAGRDGVYPMHFIQHCVAGYYDIYHGKGIATFMPAYFNYTLEKRVKKYANLARNIYGAVEDNDLKAGQIFIKKFCEWLKTINNYQGLKDIGVDRDKFSNIADDVLRLYGDGANLPGDNMGDFNKEDILNILNLAYEY